LSINASIDPGAENAGNPCCRYRDCAQISLLELGHAATARIENFSLDPIAGKNRARCLADIRIIVN
jgi:hypothetical protein